MKGEVTGEIMLIVAVLLSVSILLLQVYDLANFQIRTSKNSMTKSIAKDIASIIDSMGSVEGNSTMTYKPPKMWYRANVTDGFVYVEGKEGDILSSSFSYNCVLPSIIDDAKEVKIRKNGTCITVGTAKECEATRDCDNMYCWGTEKENYRCHDSCAPPMTYAPDVSSCCFGDEWDILTHICHQSMDCSESGSACETSDDCCNGLLCVDENGNTANNGHCCAQGYIWDEDLKSCSRPPITYGIAVIPVNWQGKANFESIANFIGSYYLERLPLDSCPDQFELLLPDLSTKYGNHWSEGYCDLSSVEKAGKTSCYTDAIEVLKIIEECANELSLATGIDYDFVVGIDDDDIAMFDSQNDICKYSVGGWSDGSGGTPAVIGEANNEERTSAIVVHELGHEFGFKEQYCDCTGTAEEGRCTTKNIIPNPLKADLGCGGAGDPNCNTGHSIDVTPSQRCPEVLGNFDMNAIDNNGDGIPDEGKRTAMSNRILYGENDGYYSTDEYNILMNDERLRCS
ncbi:MAG: hypothetical protein GXO64_03140 [Candidatus Micrarchaeota archaeon]|nr:hypothetical protein [Candidatus Micrarchaeota archaeon]